MVEISEKNVKVKICGITNLEDARRSVEAGCDALGFVFYRKSPRYISPQNALRIILRLPDHMIKIGVFVNGRERSIRRIARYCRLDMLQFHGNESPEFCNRFSDSRIIKVFRVRGMMDARDIARYKTFAYLFDTYVKGAVGGTGRRFNWHLIRHIGELKRPIFLSGGLTERNVRKAITHAQPAWVDVSSSVECCPGKKDEKKVCGFIRAAKGTALRLHPL